MSHRTSSAGATRQHYVPRFLLRGFADARTEHLHVFDKQTGDVRRAHVTKIAVRRGFYDLGLPDGSAVTLEKSLANLESDAGTIVRAIQEKESVGWLTPADRARLAHFCLVQDRRTEAQRQRIADMSAKLTAWSNEMTLRMRPGEASGSEATPLVGEELQALFLHQIAKAHEHIPLLLSKSLVLFKAPASAPFLLGDHPFAMQNTTLPPSPYGRIGLAVRGIEIYLPLSEHLTLAWLCPSFEEGVRGRTGQARALRQILPTLPLAVARSIFSHEEFLAAFDDGTPIRCAPENVENLNSLQVIAAETLLFSRRNTFDLARKMLGDNPKLRSGMRGRLQAGWGPMQSGESVDRRGHPRRTSDD